MKTLITLLKSVLQTLGKVASNLSQEGRRLWQRLPQPRRLLLSKIVIGASTLFVALFFVAALGIYLLGWQNWLTRGISRIVPFPAAFVDGRVVGYHPYALEVKKLEAGGKVGKELNRQAVGKLTTMAVVENAAVAHGISVTDKEVMSEVNRFYKSYKNKRDALAVLKKDYGLSSEGEFKRDVRHYLLNQKVEKSLRAESSKQSLKETQDLLRQLVGGAEFEPLAQQHSQHPSGMASGEGRYVPVAELPRAAAEMHAGLQDGQLAGKVATSTAGHYIVKRIDASRAQIIFRQAVNYSQWLAGEYQKARIKNLLPQTK